MKTAISLPDELFASADALAERLGISRSQLFATALAEYLAKHQSQKVTDRLNAVYATEPSTLDPALQRAQRRSLGKESW
jgi:metal-responsive CopG/Arc/MetJ family transcriptional regulator